MSKNKFLLVLPSIIVGLSIFFLSSMQRPFVELNQFDFEDKFVHLLVFFVFGVCLLIPFSDKILNTNKARGAILLILLIGLTYGGFDELHQLYVPGRVCDISDWLADALGIIISILFRFPILRFFFKSKS